MDTAIVYKAAIPNSGAHRSTWAKYGEYIYCPPQQWVHNLQRGGVAFLYHPCVHPKLKGALSLLARRYIAKHIITPLQTLSTERPLALVAWCSTLEMSHVNRTEVVAWLQDNVYTERPDRMGEGSYQHLLIRPSVMASGGRRKYKAPNKVYRLRKRGVKKRWRRFVLPVTSVAPKPDISNVSRSTTTTTSAGPPTGEYSTNRTIISSISVSAKIGFVPDPVTPGPTVYLPREAEGIKAEIHSRELEGNGQELPPNITVPTAGNVTLGLSGLNVNVSQEVVHHTDEKEKLPISAGDAHVDSSVAKPSRGPVSTVHLPPPTPPAISKSAAPQVLPSEKSLSDGKEQKQDCKCREDATAQPPAQAQRRLGAGQRKNTGMFVSTPRTEEAKWAAASLIFLFALLTFSVLYTQIYKKFRKSQSLYWNSESHSEEKESVASVIKRRLVQGHSIRKKWIGRKKNPVVLYESLSESSD
ncbi:hypothetical protein GDO81_006783 [Engystomops pustulosus]|uniref:Tumor protein p53-inducible protein 13 n=2 Tax=Engystomops pustulosus TaxID=76066 RepID=A0AAV7D1G9_ENGPU|nr:hypothetical protein GDO81_006783 [Engystomops pustulosus]KAG8590513.1 hypothetical protein GDO81_006783 [Engystomops pustulosus]